LFSWVRARFAPRVAVIGPAAGGKSTLIDVIYNHGNLVPRRNHTMTQEISKRGAIHIQLSGIFGQGELILKSFDDTPGQKDFVTEAVADYLMNFTPKVIVVVVDVSRPFFDDVPERAQSDTGKWFDAIHHKGSGDQAAFRGFVPNVACVVVVFSKYDEIHRISQNVSHNDRPHLSAAWKNIMASTWKRQKKS